MKLQEIDLTHHLNLLVKQLKHLQKNLRPLVTTEVKEIWEKTKMAPRHEQLHIFKQNSEELLKKIEREVRLAAKPLRNIVVARKKSRSGTKQRMARGKKKAARKRNVSTSKTTTASL